MTSREAQIEILEAVLAKHEAVMRTLELTLNQMRHKQVNRLAELRLQRLLKSRDKVDRR